MKLFTIVMSQLFLSLAFANELVQTTIPLKQDCGMVTGIFIETRNPPETQLQIDLREKSSKKSRISLPVAIAIRPETTTLLTKSMENDKLQFCVSSVGKGVVGIALMKK